MVQAGVWVIAAIIWGSVFSNDLMLFSAHPVCLSSHQTPLKKQDTNRLMNTAPQLHRFPLPNPSPPNPPTNPYRPPKATRNIYPLSPQLRCPLNRHRGANRNRIQQIRPQRSTLRFRTRSAGTDNIHPDRSTSPRGRNAILHAGSVWWGGECKGIV